MGYDASDKNVKLDNPAGYIAAQHIISAKLIYWMTVTHKCKCCSIGNAAALRLIIEAKVDGTNSEGASTIATTAEPYADYRQAYEKKYCHSFLSFDDKWNSMLRHLLSLYC